MYSITKEIDKAGLTFCCLQEVKYRNSGKKLIRLDNGVSYEFHWCGMKKRREAGVGFLIRVDHNIVITETDVLDPRVIAINLKIHGFNTRIVNVYSPTETESSKGKKDSFYRLLKTACMKSEKHEKLIVAGDFNAKTSLALLKCCYDGTNTVFDNDCNDNGTRLKAFCISNRLCIASTYFHYPNENRYTWYSCDKITKKVNDYVLTESYIQQYVTDCIVNPDIDLDSDHRILITSLCTPMTRRARKKVKRNMAAKSLDPKALKDNDIKNSFLNSIKNQLMSNKTGQQSSTEASVKITNMLKRAAENTLPPLTSQDRSKEIWKNDNEFNELLATRKDIPKQSAEYKNITKAVKKRINHLRNTKLSQEAEEINENENRRQVEELYRNMKNVNTTFKNLREKQQCDPSKLKEYFKTHFNTCSVTADPIELTDAPDFIKKLHDINDTELNMDPPDIEELRSTIKSLKYGKSANDVPPAYVKHAMECKEFELEIFKLFETIWRTNKIPKSWGHTKLVALWKGPSKGKQNDPKAYRGIQIGSTLCKILAILIINRLKRWYERQLLDQQQGFRSGRGTADGIYILKHVHQITDKMKKPTYALFIDLAAAFDHVNRNMMFKTISKRLPASERKLVQLMESLYSHTTTALNQTPDEDFELTAGVRQGGPESPVLFNLFIDFVMRVYIDKCKSTGIKFLQLNYKIPTSATVSCRITAGKQTIDWAGYADDLVLMFEDVKNLTLGLKLLSTTFNSYHLEINISKTKTMILNHQFTNEEYPDKLVNLNNTPIENVKIFKYLGCNVKYNEPTTGDAELEMRIDTAHCKFYELGKNMMNFRISLATRVKVLNALVRSRLTYSCQTWTLTKRQTSHTNAIYVSMLRKMVRGGYRRKIGTYHYELSNSDILQKCKTEDIYQFIARQQRNFIAHVIRGENNRMTKRLLFNNDATKKPGRRISLYMTVLENERSTPDEFNNNALSRKF